jgi:hypothetical protein
LIDGLKGTGPRLSKEIKYGDDFLCYRNASTVSGGRREKQQRLEIYEGDDEKTIDSESCSRVVNN